MKPQSQSSLLVMRCSRGASGETFVAGSAQLAMLPVAARFTAYFLIVAGVIQGLLHLASSEVYAVEFDEGRFVEWAQVALVCVTTSLLGVAAYLHRGSRGFLLVITLVCLIAMVRELDSMLDRLIPIFGWQLVAVPVAGAALWLTIRHFERCCSQAMAWLQSPAAGIVWSGTVTVLIYAQITGQAQIWRAVMGDNYTRHFKRVIEESAEMFGYLLIFFGAIETLLWVISLRRQQRQAAVATRPRQQMQGHAE